VSGRGGCILALVLAISLAGCASALRWSADEHEVRPGETLYAIAWRYGLDHRELAASNRLGDGSLIRPGQRIRLTPPSGGVPASSPARRRTPGGAPPPGSVPAPAVGVDGWAWPVEGAVLDGWRASPGTQSGIRVGGRTGQPVRAAAGGTVVYAGRGLASYGQLLIVKHNENYLSAYGYNQALLVGEGDTVRAGQKIARMGQGPGRKALLHFEIRRNGEPVTPLKYLPTR